MLWRLVLLMWCTFGFGRPALAFEVYGTTGLALGGPSTTVAGNGEVFANPALLDRGRARGEIIFQFPGRETHRSFNSEFRHAYSEFLTAKGTLVTSPTTQNAQTALSKASNLFGKHETYLESYSVSISFPSLPLAVGAYFRGTHLETRRVDSLGVADLSDLANPKFNASYTAKTATVLETGTAFSRNFGAQSDGASDWSVGFRPKLQVIQFGFSSFDLSTGNSSSNLTNYLNDGWINFDVGVVGTYQYRWRWGVQVYDLLPRTSAYSSGDNVQVNPHTRLALLYSQSGWTWVGGGDIGSQDSWTGENAHQLISMGLEKTITDFAHLRVSTTYDLQSKLPLGGAGLVIHWGPADGELSYGQTSTANMISGNIHIGF